MIFVRVKEALANGGENMNRLVVMTVGMTHSGKSTFAQTLKSRLENAIVIDQDNHAEFLQTYYEKLLPKKA